MSVPASPTRRRTGSEVGQARRYPWSWVSVVGVSAVVEMVAGTFAAETWFDDSIEWLNDTRIVLLMLVLLAAPVVALGLVGRLAFGNVRYLARIGALTWAGTLGVAWASSLWLARAGEPVGQAERVTPETFVAIAFSVVISFLFAWALMSLGVFAGSILGRSRSHASRA